MRVLLLLLMAGLSGCLAAQSPVDVVCEEADHTYWFGPGMALRSEPAPKAGHEEGNGFSEAFLTNDLKEWTTASFAQGLRIEGNVTLEYWARNTGTPAPVMAGGGPGEGYHFFNQFGSDRGFQPGYAIAYASAAPEPGSVDRYQQELEMPPGGFFVEPGDHLRLLLTSLVMDDDSGSGHEILYGGDTPSRISFSAACWRPPAYGTPEVEVHPVEIPAHRGLLTGAVPAMEGLNQASVPFTLHADTHRLTIRLEQDPGEGPKDDMDLVVLDADGEVWGIGSPYSDEVGTLWRANLEAVMPPGEYTVRVDSYSGHAYSGWLRIVQEPAA